MDDIVPDSKDLQKPIQTEPTLAQIGRQPVEPPANSSPSTTSKSHTKRTMIIAGLVLLVMACFGAAVLFL